MECNLMQKNGKQYKFEIEYISGSTEHRIFYGTGMNKVLKFPV